MAVCALSSSVIFSGTTGEACKSVYLTTPCAKPAWSVDGNALYLKAGSTSGGYRFVSKRVSDSTFANYPEDWSWAFKIGGSYQYGVANGDVAVNWYHLDQQAHSQFIGVYSYAQFVTSPDAVMSPSDHPKWDAVNFEIGQLVNFNEVKTVRFHAGFQYARVDYSTGAEVVDYGVSINLVANSQYNGFGPRLGADMTYNLTHGFGVYGNAAAALLIGNSSFDNEAEVYSPYNSKSSNYLSQTTVVPVLEGKLGLNFNQPISQGNLIGDVGWIWANYFNAHLNSLSTGADVVNSDFGLQGLYFGLKWLGSIA